MCLIHELKIMKKYNGHVAPVHIFFSGSGDTGKSHSVKKMYIVISKTLLYHCKDPQKPFVLVLELNLEERYMV